VPRVTERLVVAIAEIEVDDAHGPESAQCEACGLELLLDGTMK
jgi:hypothetical protein